MRVREEKLKCRQLGPEAKSATALGAWKAHLAMQTQQWSPELIPAGMFVLQVPRVWCEFLSDNLWPWRPSLVSPQQVCLLQLGSYPRIVSHPPHPPAKKETGLTRSFLSFPGVSHRLRHVCGQPQRGVPHARAIALAAPACGHQQRCGRCTPARTA